MDELRSVAVDASVEATSIQRFAVCQRALPKFGLYRMPLQVAPLTTSLCCGPHVAHLASAGTPCNISLEVYLPLPIIGGDMIGLLSF
jgi:hypothetical protein